MLKKDGIADDALAVCESRSSHLRNSQIKNRLPLYESMVGSSYVEKFLGENTELLVVLMDIASTCGISYLKKINSAAKEREITVLLIVITPFAFEGLRQKHAAISGIELVKEYADAVTIVSNEEFRKAYPDLTLDKLYEISNQGIASIVKGLIDITLLPGYVNVDIKDVKLVLKDAGLAMITTHLAKGPDRADEAATAALASPFIGKETIKGARYILLTISSGSKEVSMDEVSTITDLIQEEAGLQADLIWGNCKDDTLGEAIRVTIIITGFSYDSNTKKIEEMASTLQKMAINGSPEALSLYFLAEEYSPDEIAEVISFLSDIYREVGGDGLVINGKDVLEYESVCQPLIC